MSNSVSGHYGFCVIAPLLELRMLTSRARKRKKNAALGR
jgi:hypothetical protein